MKNFRLFFYYLFVSLFIFEIVAKELLIYEHSELFENQLFNFLYNSVDKELLKKVKFSDLTAQKSVNLNFRDAVFLYLFSMQNSKYKKYTIWALERIYALSSDAQLNELLLWNLAFHYEKKENFVVASGLYNLFKKMFPGSQFYWESRYKEILMTYLYCHEYYHDISDIEQTMKLCEEYMLDIALLESDFSFKVIEIYQDLSLRIIKKNLGIVSFYENKFGYSRELTSFFSCLQRFSNISHQVDRFLNFSYENINNKKNQIYLLSLQEIEKLIILLFETCGIETLPIGESFIDEYTELQKRIKVDRYLFRNHIREAYEKINNFVDAYYEL